MSQTFEQRIQHINDELSDIRVEIEEDLARYKESRYPFKAEDVQLYINGEKFDGYKPVDTEE